MTKERSLGEARMTRQDVFRMIRCWPRGIGLKDYLLEHGVLLPHILVVC